MEDNRFRVINCMPEFCNEYCSEFSEDIETLRTGGPGEEHKTIIALKCYHQEACKKAAEFAVKKHKLEGHELRLNLDLDSIRQNEEITNS